MQTRILTRELLDSYDQPWKNPHLLNLIADLQKIESRLCRYTLEIDAIETLIEAEKYRAAEKEITRITHEIHKMSPDDPLFVFNIYGHLINLECVRLQTHIDVICFFAEEKE